MARARESAAASNIHAFKSGRGRIKYHALGAKPAVAIIFDRL